MTDRENQINKLQRIFGAASLSPVFKDNEKFDLDGVPRIAYDDVMERRCIIRCDDRFPESGGYWSGREVPVVAQYQSIEELVDDGWRLD
jgi:hypothetical protein